MVEGQKEKEPTREQILQWEREARRSTPQLPGLTQGFPASVGEARTVSHKVPAHRPFDEDSGNPSNEDAWRTSEE